MKSAIFVTLFSAVVLISTATHVSETVHRELSADVAARAKSMQFPEEQVRCIMREASKFEPTNSANGEKKYDIVAYRTHVTDALQTCLFDKADESLIGVVRSSGSRKPLCSCTSGCHPCCVSFGIGGAYSCFSRFCKQAFCRGKAVCY